MYMTHTIGFIGLGNMGLPMAINLVNAGYKVLGFDTNEASNEKFVANGGTAVGDVVQLIAESTVVLTSLPTPQVVSAVYRGPKGIIQTANRGTILVDFSTVNPQLNDELYADAQQAELHYLGAPVSGGVIGAINATLTIMVGGESEIHQQMTTILNTLGKNIYHLGISPSIGTRIKLLNNLMIGFYTEAVAETIVLGEQMGIEADILFEVLSNSYGQSRIFERNYLEYMKNDDYNPGFTTNLLLKDLKLAKEMAQQVGVPLPIGDKLVDLYSTISEEGFGDKDMAASYLSLKNKTKIEQL